MTGSKMLKHHLEYCVADAAHVTAIPDQVPAAMAAPLLCGGITMYGALVNALLKPGDFVVLLGAGGGLGHIGVQIGSTLGYRVIAIDTADKENVCISSGAEVFFAVDKSNSLVEKIKSATRGVGAHAVLCVAGATSAYDDAVSMLRNCGQLICIGIPPADYRMKVNPFELLVRGLKIVGSTVGDTSQMKELMELAVQKKIKPMVQMFEFEDVEAVLKSLGSGTITGRAVLLIPQ